MAKGKKESVTIQDVAKKLGVSPSTVSRSLNNNPKISDETKQRVYKAAKDMGYQPNIPGFFEKNNKQKNICIIVPNLKDIFYIDVISRIQEDLVDYNCIVASSLNSVAREKQFVENFLDLGIDGFFISLCNCEEVDHIHHLLKKDKPVILFNNVNFDLHVQKVVVDYFQGAYNAVLHLVSMNCNNIALVKGAQASLVNKDIQQGYKVAIDQSDIEYNSSNVFTLNRNLLNDKIIFDALLNSEAGYDAVIFTDNNLAMQFIAQAKRYDFMVPEDILVVCCGGEKCNEYLSPSITTIDCDSDKMGALVAKCFLNQMQLSERINNSLIIPSKIVLRTSSMRD